MSTTSNPSSNLQTYQPGLTATIENEYNPKIDKYRMRVCMLPKAVEQGSPGDTSSTSKGRHLYEAFSLAAQCERKFAKHWSEHLAKHNQASCSQDIQEVGKSASAVRTGWTKFCPNEENQQIVETAKARLNKLGGKYFQPEWVSNSAWTADWEALPPNPFVPCVYYAIDTDEHDTSKQVYSAMPASLETRGLKAIRHLNRKKHTNGYHQYQPERLLSQDSWCSATDAADAVVGTPVSIPEGLDTSTAHPKQIITLMATQFPGCKYKRCTPGELLAMMEKSQTSRAGTSAPQGGGRTSIPQGENNNSSEYMSGAIVDSDSEAYFSAVSNEVSEDKLNTLESGLVHLSLASADEQDPFSDALTVE